MSRRNRRNRALAAAMAASLPADGTAMSASAQGPAAVIGMGGVGGVQPAYRASGFDSQETATWFPTRSSGDALTLSAKDLSLARVRDMVRNDPNARAAVERLVDLIVGPGLHLLPKPDGDALGIKDRRVLQTFAKSLQREWNLFANDPRHTCDLQRKLSMNGLFRLLARTWLVAGEATAVMSWKAAPKGRRQRYSTCVLAVDPDRLSNPNNEAETPTLRGGVEMDLNGAPTAYHFRNAHIGDWWNSAEAWIWTRIERETSWGRPVVVHAFEPERENQTRGISPFVSLITRLKMIGKFADNELASAAANALYAAFVESALPTSTIAENLSPRAAVPVDQLVKHYTRNPVHIGGSRIPVMLPGSTIKMNNMPRQTASFESFQRSFLRSIASALGISYEQLSMDWSQTNYSSARAALNEVWRSVQRMRATFVEQVVQPIYYSVVEEAFDKGYITLPAEAKPIMSAANDNLSVFQELPGAILRAKWVGPGRGYVDPLKEAQAAALRMASLTSTLDEELSEQGKIFEEVLDQLEYEAEELEARGISRQSIGDVVDGIKGMRPGKDQAASDTSSDDSGDDASEQTIADLQAYIAELEARLAA